MILATIRDGFVFGPWEIEIIVRLVAAAIFGGFIGLERKQHGRSAGLRTHLLVALGAAMAMVVSLHFGEVYGKPGGVMSIRVDPARVAYGVMAGIGFLGAGAIMQYGAGIRGLTTAASLWCTAAIGLGTGFGMFAVSFVAVIIVLFALIVLNFVDRRIPVRLTRRITLNVPGTSAETINRYEELLKAEGVNVINVGYACDFENDHTTVTLRVSARSTLMSDGLARLRSNAPEIRNIKVD
ncbi:MAG: MgtC/SapB family protein [Planctomycetota bacterium]|nr:MgtC/SapB family protein [Planctomycetota bacterium]